MAIVEAFCMRCKQKRRVQQPVRKLRRTAKGLRAFVSGYCPVCGAKMSKIIPTDQVPLLDRLKFT